MSLKEIGELIKKRRDSLHLRQEDLAEMGRVGLKTLHLVEQGKGNPSFETLQKLAEVLGLEIILKVKQIN